MGLLRNRRHGGGPQRPGARTGAAGSCRSQDLSRKCGALVPRNSGISMSDPEPVSTEASRRTKIKAVIRVATGNFLEMYDFFVFGYYAAAIGRTYFPGNSDFASLMLSFAT